MYEEYYNLKDRPFRLRPDHRFFFESRGHRRALAYLRYGIARREGFIVVTGGIGTGKTTLVETLSNEISRESEEKLVTAKLVTTQLEADDLLRTVCASFGLPYEHKSKAGLLIEIQTFFQMKGRNKERVLLIIDEAQNIPKQSLEELRMLSNLEVDGIPVLQTFLLGQNEFLEILQASDMEQLRQRVIAAYRLKPLSRDETRAYIEHRLELVGWGGDPTFTDEAYGDIYRLTGGIPRRINIFCDRLLLFGYLEEIHEFNRKAVQTVAQELYSELNRPGIMAGLAGSDSGDEEDVASDSASKAKRLASPGAPNAAHKPSNNVSFLDTNMSQARPGLREAATRARDRQTPRSPPDGFARMAAGGAAPLPADPDHLDQSVSHPIHPSSDDDYVNDAPAAREEGVQERRVGEENSSTPEAPAADLTGPDTDRGAGAFRNKKVLAILSAAVVLVAINGAVISVKYIEGFPPGAAIDEAVEQAPTVSSVDQREPPPSPPVTDNSDKAGISQVDELLARRGGDAEPPARMGGVAQTLTSSQAESGIVITEDKGKTDSDDSPNIAAPRGNEKQSSPDTRKQADTAVKEGTTTANTTPEPAAVSPRAIAEAETGRPGIEAKDSQGAAAAAPRASTVAENTRPPKIPETNQVPDTRANDASNSGADKTALAALSKKEIGRPIDPAINRSLPEARSAKATSSRPPTVASMTQRSESQGTRRDTIQTTSDLAKKFSQAYEAGDLKLLLSLFADDAQTNDQNDKAGIGKDYRELFELSETRRFSLNGIKWERTNDQTLNGEGTFHAEIRFKSNDSVAIVDGKIYISARRNQEGILITKLFHTYD